MLTFTGDSGPDDGVVGLARGADLLLAEASFADEVPEDSRRYLSSARQQGRQAAAAGAGRLLLTHLLPGTDPWRCARSCRAGLPRRGRCGPPRPGRRALTRPRPQRIPHHLLARGSGGQR